MRGQVPVLDQLISPGHLQNVIASSGIATQEYQLDELSRVTTSQVARPRSLTAPAVVHARLATLAAIEDEIATIGVDRIINHVRFSDELPSRDEESTWNYPTDEG